MLRRACVRRSAAYCCARRRFQARCEADPRKVPSYLSACHCKFRFSCIPHEHGVLTLTVVCPLPHHPDSYVSVLPSKIVLPAWSRLPCFAPSNSVYPYSRSSCTAFFPSSFCFRPPPAATHLHSIHIFYSLLSPLSPPPPVLVLFIFLRPYSVSSIPRGISCTDRPYHSTSFVMLLPRALSSYFHDSLSINRLAFLLCVLSFL